jgi:hypothetical protein
MDIKTVRGLSEHLEVSETTVYRWIREKQLHAEKRNGTFEIPETRENLEFIVRQIRAKGARSRGPYVPDEIRSYEQWHQVLDEFCWLIKICYSDRHLIQRRKFRLDQLFLSYLQSNKISTDAVQAELRSGAPPMFLLITDDLKRGWYNELAYVTPLRASILGLSFKDVETNKRSSSMRFTFPSWRIITAYYAVYFYLRSATLHNFDKFRLQEHSATITCFKHNALPSLKRIVWKFPFDISYAPKERIRRRELMGGALHQFQYQYSRHPREPQRTPLEIYEHIRQVFQKRAKRHTRLGRYTLFDYLHDFRVWANYLDIDNLLSLRGEGYKSLLDQNLALILFLVGGIAEILHLSRFGEGRYLKQLQDFYKLTSENTPEMEQGFRYAPMYQRLCIFRYAGLISGDIELKVPADFNLVQFEEHSQHLAREGY